MSEITKEDIAESTEVVNTILLWRIYDALLVLIDAVGGDAESLANAHDAGLLIGPNPSVRSEEVDEDAGE